MSVFSFVYFLPRMITFVRLIKLSGYIFLPNKRVVRIKGFKFPHPLNEYPWDSKDAGRITYHHLYPISLHHLQNPVSHWILLRPWSQIPSSQCLSLCINKVQWNPVTEHRHQRDHVTVSVKRGSRYTVSSLSTDASLKRTPRVGPCISLLLLVDSL